METPDVLKDLSSFIEVSKKDKQAELECKLLSRKIETEDVAERMMKAIQSLSIGAPIDETRLTVSYPDNIRVNVLTAPLVQKVCVQESFKDVPLTVETKKPYGNKDVIDLTDYNTKFTLRQEKELRKDWEGSLNDPKAVIRIINRKSFKTANEFFRIDFSMVRTRLENSKRSIKNVLKDHPKYELEIEFINKETKVSNESIAKEFLKTVNILLQAYYQTPFILSNTELKQYVDEFNKSRNTFYNPVTLERRYLNIENPHNIAKGYTVTVKADGNRSGLYVARDRKVLLIPKEGAELLTWTGITARTDSHVGDFVDGEYISYKRLFCIFDVLRFRNRDVKTLPLLTNDEEVLKHPLNCRIGCARLFVEDLKTHFIMSPTAEPIRIETKLFLAGDGAGMEESIKTILNTQFEYETDGLIFTPRDSGLAPPESRRGDRWLYCYKWKPPHQNTIDFLLKFSPDQTIDPITGEKAVRGELYVGKKAKDDIVYPRETITGEYKPKDLPPELQEAKEKYYVPALFQPYAPRDPDAYVIYIPLNGHNVPVDEEGKKVRDNTNVECRYDMELNKWKVMRTRYDKTYRYQVKKETIFGNDVQTADNIWTSIHVPITEGMITNFVSNPPDSSYEDNMYYYRDDQKRSSRHFADVYDFHNMIKEQQYKTYLNQGDTLLELAYGRGGDMFKIRDRKPSKVVTMDITLATIVAPNQGAAARYLRAIRNDPHIYMPPFLFLEGDMKAYPWFNQQDKYMPILNGDQTAPTEYLAKFENIHKFDQIASQFALHYVCESEEVFRDFAKNVQKYCKEYFFGTCSDGQAIYSLLLGKKKHLFMADKEIVGEYTKLYDDNESWKEEFGLPVRVMLESFMEPKTEYLVPMEKITEIMREHGFALVESKNFKEIYDAQTKYVLTAEQQAFSFTNRTFVFKRMTRSEKQEAEEQQEKEVQEVESEKKVEEEPPKEEEPKKVRLKKKEATEEEPILFFGADESKGEYKNFSNMSAHPIEIDGQKYPTVEHYFQAMKAKTFEDEDMFEKIIKSKTPKAAKALGVKVNNFVTEVWDAKRDEIMERGIKAKFVQHPELRKQLLATEEKMIGEANPRDTYWGIGTGIESEKSKHPSKWRGQNKIGKILMTLRTELRNESI